MKKLSSLFVCAIWLLISFQLANSQTPTSCVVHGTVFDWDLTTKTRLEFEIVEVTKAATLLPQFGRKVHKSHKTTGVVAFVLPRLSNAKIRANVSGFDGTVFFCYPRCGFCLAYFADAGQCFHSIAGWICDN